MKIAFVYDRINKFGGAERILLALHEIWPEAPLYTSVSDPSKAKWAKTFDLHTSFLQHVPFSSSRHELFANFTPYSFEAFNFDAYDVVISITSADAKGIITKPHTLHICYCLTPTRYIWSGYQDYLLQPGLGGLNGLARMFLNFSSVSGRKWDYISSQRPDQFIAISNTVAQRIHTYYKKNAEVIYPPMDTHAFRPGGNKLYKNAFYLVVSRLVPYKRIDYVIDTFNKLGEKLKIIGSGIDEKRLKKRARKNIDFICGDLTDKELCWYYQNCTALIFPGEEDFGLTALEAQSCGKPVLALNRGGVTETVIPGKTGEFYPFPTVESLVGSLHVFRRSRYAGDSCVQNANRFSKKKFQSLFRKTVENSWSSFQKTL